MTSLAILGGEPAFPGGLPFARPATPPLARVVARLTPSYEAGRLTNGPLVAELEAQVRVRLGVEHVVAVANCTAGLMLAVRALAMERRVAMPSFTFSATAHAAAWHGAEIVFADCDRGSFQVDPVDLGTRLDDVGLLMATHVFGAPCPVEALQHVSQERGIPLLLDAAHALGAERGGQPIGGFGDAEVFSLSPTKTVVAGEGGLVTTNRGDVAEAIRIGRDYGNADDYDSRFVGLNARMSELHAAVALEALAELDDHLARRAELAAEYRDALVMLPGISVQHVDAGDVSTWKDLTLAVDGNEFGLDRDELVTVLAAEGIDTRCYFDPPVHLHQAYGTGSPPRLPVTEEVAKSVFSLPLYRDLPREAPRKVIDVVGASHRQADRVRAVAAKVPVTPRTSSASRRS